MNLLSISLLRITQAMIFVFPDDNNDDKNLHHNPAFAWAGHGAGQMEIRQSGKRLRKVHGRIRKHPRPQHHSHGG